MNQQEELKALKEHPSYFRRQDPRHTETMKRVREIQRQRADRKREYWEDY